MEGIRLENSSSPFHSFRDLPPNVLLAKGMRLVDPKKQATMVRSHDPDNRMASGKTVRQAVSGALASGLFSMSEIAFDVEYHYAIVRYDFWCGSLCGNGATLVFEKIGGEWKRTDRECGGWVS
jgi:hypothetical protein